MQALVEVCRGLELCLAAMFLAAAIHKLAILRRREAHLDPLVALVDRRGNHAVALLAAAGLAEVGVAAALAVVPVAGLTATVGLLAAYIATLRRLPAETGCACFGAFAPTTGAVAAVRRDAVLIALALALIPASLLMGVDVAPTSVSLLMLFLTVGAVLGAAALRATTPGLFDDQIGRP